MASHPDRVRTSELPAGYQFGDAAGPDWLDRFVSEQLAWRAPHENAADRLRLPRIADALAYETDRERP